MATTLSVATGTAAQDDAARGTTEPATIVVTTEVLGSIVADLVGDDADVIVLMDGGADPHSWQPSARDAQSIFDADLVVANGLGLEEGLSNVLEEAQAEDVPVFTATDHIADLVPSGERPPDPHFWLDPVAMQAVAASLAAALTDVGVEATEGATEVIDALDALDAETAASVAALPAERRRLVTGHDALGYYAHRYGFEIIGTVLPGVSTSGEASARDLAELIEAIKAAGSTVVFTDVGTPQSVAAAVASDGGASIVELEVGAIPEGGDYGDLIRSLTAAIVAGLSATP